MLLSPEDRKRRDIAAAKHSLGPGILGQVTLVAIDQLVPYAQNARTHSDEQLAIIGQSLRTFGWMSPVLADDDNNIIAGHGRVEAARRLGFTEVTMLRISGLTPDQVRAYRLADNRIAEIAGWDSGILAIELQHITKIDIGCSIKTLG